MENRALWARFFIDPSGLAWFDNWHFEGRDALNGPHPTIVDVRLPNSGWILLPKEMSVFHDNGMGKPELKYVHPDGREAVFDGDTCEAVTDPRYKGTYNYVTPALKPENRYDFSGWREYVNTGTAHIVFDVAPYLLSGNKNIRNQHILEYLNRAGW